MSGTASALGLDVGERGIKAAWRRAQGGVETRVWPIDPDLLAGRSLAHHLPRMLLEYRQLAGQPAAVVVAVPEHWRDEPGGQAAAELRRLVAREIRGVPARFVTQPVGVLAARLKTGLPEGLTPVCDVGWSQVTASLAEVRGGQVTVHASATSPGSGIGAFLDALCSCQGGWLLSREAIAQELYRSAVDTNEMIEEIAGDPRFRDAAIYQVAGVTWTLDQVTRSWESTARELRRVVGQVAQQAGTRSISSVVLTGGFGAFPLVRRAVEAELGRQVQGSVWSTDRDGETAIDAARGALLIASGELDPVARFDRAVLIAGHRRHCGRLEVADLPIAPASTVEIGGVEPVWLMEAGQAAVLTTRGSVVETTLIRVGSGDDRASRIDVRLNPPLRPGRYHVGLQVRRNGEVCLLFQPVGDGPLSLGMIPPRVLTDLG